MEIDLKQVANLAAKEWSSKVLKKEDKYIRIKDN